MHRRTRPAANAFRYPAFCLRLPLSRLPDLSAAACAESARAGELSQWRPRRARRSAARRLGARVLAREGVACSGEIVLYTFPRMLGYVFNPVSFWVCHDDAGRACAVLAEVANTFGESHRYLLSHPDGLPLVSGETLRARKASRLAVLRGRGRYRSAFISLRSAGSRVSITSIPRTETREPLLVTSISGVAQPLPRRSPLSLFFRYRWFTLGVIARIHWQAAKLWASGFPGSRSRRRRRQRSPAIDDQRRSPTLCLEGAHARGGACAVHAPGNSRARPRRSRVPPDGVTRVFGPGGAGLSAVLHLRDWRVVSRSSRAATSGSPKPTSPGRWNTPDLTQLLTVLAANQPALERAFYGRWWMRRLLRLRHRRRQHAAAGERNILAHYDLGNAFYALGSTRR